MKFNDLLPSELIKIKEQIEIILVKLGMQKTTNQKYQIKNRIKKCPKCKSTKVIKYGYKDGTQRYQCKECKKVFSININSIIYHSKLNYNQLSTIIKDIVDNKTLKIIAYDSNLSEREIYNIKAKIMNTLNEFEKNVKLNGIVQCDEKYIRLSFKGTRKEKMPRKSRKNGFEDRTSGISKEQVCVIVAIDNKDNIIAKIAGLGPASTDMIEKALGNNIGRWNCTCN